MYGEDEFGAFSPTLFAIEKNTFALRISAF